MERLLLILLLVTTGCGGEEASRPEVSPDSSTPWAENIEEPVPTWLSETGVFSDLADLSPANGFHPYEPPHPLWSNAADKLRFLFVPEGHAITTNEQGQWRFPVGTVMSKTFTMHRIEGRGRAVAIETRLMFLRNAGWDYAVYHWNAEGTEARLETGNWGQVELRLSDPTGNELPYVIPSKLDCRGCHEAQVGEPVIGIHPNNFDEALTELPVFETSPDVRPLPAESPEEAAAMSYFVGNCAFCHHGGNQGNDNASFSLLPDDLRAMTINQETASSASGIGIRVVPGNPEGSALYEAVVLSRDPDYAGDFKPMPPLGIVRPDPDVARIIHDWIMSL